MDRRISLAVGVSMSRIVASSAFCTVKYSTYDGPTRKATSAKTTITIVVNRNPIMDKPRSFRPTVLPSLMRAPMIPGGPTHRARSLRGGERRVRGGSPSTLMDRAADALECQRRDVVPVEPDEEGLASQVVVRDESPIPAVVAVVPVVAHHEVLAGRDPARKAVLIVFAIFAPGERPDIGRVHRLRLRIDPDRMHE